MGFGPNTPVLQYSIIPFISRGLLLAHRVGWNLRNPGSIGFGWLLHP